MNHRLTSCIDQVLIPSDDAVSEYLSSEGFGGDTDAFTEALVTYHLLQGTHSMIEIQESTKFIPTFLTNTSYENVTGGQRVEARSSGDDIYFLSCNRTRSNVIHAVHMKHLPLHRRAFQLIQVQDIYYFGANYTYNGIIHIIDNVLDIPEDYGDVVSEASLHGLVQVLSQTPPSERLNTIIAEKGDWTLYEYTLLTLSHGFVSFFVVVL